MAGIGNGNGTEAMTEPLQKRSSYIVHRMPALQLKDAAHAKRPPYKVHKRSGWGRGKNTQLPSSQFHV